MTKALTKEDLRKAFEAINKVPLQNSQFLMNERDYAEMVGLPCPECGRMISPLTDNSVVADNCGTCAIRDVMEE